jgi:hypothetical protein
MLSIAILFTIMLENFLWHIQNPNDQLILTILVSALYAYPEMGNSCLKQQKIIKKASASFWL